MNAPTRAARRRATALLVYPRALQLGLGLALRSRRRRGLYHSVRTT
ncbi:hypothetical protein VMT65_11585 [Nocardia sp. CDC153]|nr:hypothetical protein [Nocardia sp. CDC153]MEC3953676.1 hypothetical protein [Nocardia sp. CDC153]